MNNYLAHYGVKGMRWGVHHDYRKGGVIKKVKLFPECLQSHEN